LSLLNGTCDGSLIEYLSSLLRIKILRVVPPLMALLMVVPPSSFLLVQRFEANLDDNLMCIVVAGSELSLVEFGGLTPPHFARSVFYS
jgi:hypothetical protein